MSKKKRIVAYVRVSTNSKDQKNSFENQQSFFLDKLSKFEDEYTIAVLPTNKNGIYADRGWSGTKLVRPELDKMLQDAGLKRVVSEETGKQTDKYEIISKPKFDCIFVKDTSRFARNVSADDLLKTLRKNGVIVYFYDINRTTETLNDITAIQIFLSLGESESSRKSDNVKIGYREGAKKGNVYMGGAIIGYDYIKKDDKRPYETNILKANKDADLVRLVFDLYTEQGLGHQQICNELAKRGYFNSKGHKYTRSTISRMLENEKYAGINTAGRYTYGDLFNKKQVEIDYNDEVRVKARQETQRLADEGIVQRIEPIVTLEQFEKAQKIRERNRKKYNNDSTYHGITAYARKIKCGACGAWYTAQSRKYTARIQCENCGTWHIEQLEKPERKATCRKCGASYSIPSRNDMKGKCKMTRYYACAHRFAYDEANGIKKCNNPSITEDKLDAVLNSDFYYKDKLTAIEDILGASYYCVQTLEEAIQTDNDAVVKDLDSKIKDLGEEKDRLIPLYAKGIYSEEKLEEMTADYNAQISEMTARRNQLAKGNDEIRTDIALVKELAKAAGEEHEEVLEALKTKHFPKRTQKEQLKDIDYISIDWEGNPNLVFKSLKEIEQTVSYLEHIRKSYEKDDTDSTPKQTLEEVMAEINKKGTVIRKGLK